MTFINDVIADPSGLAVMMAALALVASLVCVLHYAVDRRTLLERVRRLESALAAQKGNGADDDEQARAVYSVPAMAPPQEEDDALPPGIRFV